MTAKISDLGVARILNLTPLQVSRITMTETPGTPAYMPPEVMVANPKYDTSVDDFSYGIMMIHMFSGQWPEPQVEPIHTELDGRMTPVSEAERREVFLRTIGNDHPLMDLILKCIHNHPRARAHASEIVGRLAEMVLQFPASFANRLEMLRQIEEDEREKRAFTEEGERKDKIIQEKSNEILMNREEILALTEEGESKDRVIQQKENQISSLRKDILAKEEQKSAEIDRLKLAHSSEVEQLNLQARDLNTQKQLAAAKMEAEIAELKSNATVYKSQIETSSRIQFQERERFKQIIAQEREQREHSELQLAQEREAVRESDQQLREVKAQLEAVTQEKNELLQNQGRVNARWEVRVKHLECQLRDFQNGDRNLQSDLSKTRSENTNLLCTISELQADTAEKDGVIQMKDTVAKRKDSELEAKSRALEEKDATISAMSQQITKTREYLVTTKQQVSAIKIDYVSTAYNYRT